MRTSFTRPADEEEVLRVGKERFFRLARLSLLWKVAAVAALATLVALPFLLGASLADAGAAVSDGFSFLIQRPLLFFRLGVEGAWSLTLALLAVVAVVLVLRFLPKLQEGLAGAIAALGGGTLAAQERGERVAGLLGALPKNLLWVIALLPVWLSLAGSVLAMVGLLFGALFLARTAR